MADSTVSAPIAVTGATGRQGGAVARHLLDAGFRVRALTRNPASPAARTLRERGAELAAADMEDRASLERALEGCRGLFSVQNYWEKGVGYDGEVRQGRNLADAASAAGIEHLVQGSIAQAGEARGVRHWECKAEIEQYVDDLGLPRTFLGETFFMDNFLDPKHGSVMLPFLASTLAPETRLWMVAVDDIGAAAATVFARPERFLGRSVPVAGDRLTFSEMRETIRRVAGRAKGFRLPRWFASLVNREMVDQLRWNNAPGWSFPEAEAREVLPAPTTFASFLERHRDQLS